MTYKRLPAVLLVVYLTAVTPVTKIEVVGGLPERELCVDGVWTPLKDTDEDPSRCISQGLKPAGPASQSAQQMRRGRVGFHHEDITADASLRSLWSSFRESLPGVAEDELKPRHPRVNHVQQVNQTTTPQSRALCLQENGDWRGLDSTKCYIGNLLKLILAPQTMRSLVNRSYTQ